MDSLINRQAAIDALKKISFSHWFECGEYLSEDTREIEIINSNKAFEAIEALPSAQPELCESDEAAKRKRLNDLISDINPWEICSQIEADNLSDWCKTIQTEMKMAMVQLPCWAGRRTDECTD